MNNIFLFLTSILSLATHFYLSTLHYSLKLGLADGKSLCNINDKFNCDAVTLSSYSTLLGAPLSNWGLATQVVLLLFVSAALLGSKWWLRIGFWLSLFTAVTSVVMGAISTFALGTYCLFCIATYILSWLNLYFFWRATGKEALATFATDIKALFGAQKTGLIMLALVPGFAYLSQSVFLDSYGFGKLNESIQSSIATWKTASAQNFNLQDGVIAQEKNIPPKLIIVEFADFLCPHCKFAQAPLKAFLKNHADVQLVFKPFPLDGKCNEAVTHKGDGLRCQLSYAVLCTQKLEPSKASLMQNMIFERQEQWKLSSYETDIKAIAETLQLPWENLSSCMSSSEIHALTMKIAKEGSDAKIMGTPTIFANNQVLEKGHFLPILEAAYKELNP